MSEFSDLLGQANAEYAAAAGQGIQTLGDFTNVQSISDFGKELHDTNQAEAIAYGQPDVSSLSDIKGWTDVNGMGEYAKFALSQAVPPMAITLGSMAFGAGAGVAIGGEGAAGAGALLGSWLANVPSSVGNVAQEIEDRGGAQNKDSIALAAGSLLAGLPVAMSAKILSPVAGALSKDVGIDALEEGLIKHLGLAPTVAKSTIQAMAEGGAFTGVQQGATDLLAGYVTGNEFTPQELMDRVANAAAIGAISTSGLGSFSGAAKTVFNNADFVRLQKIQQKAEDMKQGIMERTLGDYISSGGGLVPLVDDRGRPKPVPTINPAVFEKNVNLLDTSIDTYGKALRTTDPSIQEPGFFKLAMNTIMGRSGALFERWAPSGQAGLDLASAVFSPNSRKMLGHATNDLWNLADEYTAPKLQELEGHVRGIQNAEDDSKVALAIRDTSAMLAMEKTHPELAATAKGIKKIYDDIYLDARLQGLQTGHTVDYLPRYWKSAEIEASPELQNELKRLAVMYGAVDSPDSRAFTEGLRHITRGKGMLYPEDLAKNAERDGFIAQVLSGQTLQNRRLGMLESTPRHRSLESSRVWASIPDTELAKAGLIHSNVSRITSEYVKSAGKRLTAAKVFGNNEEKLRANIIQAAQDLDAKGAPMTRHELMSYYGLVDAFHNMYKPIASQGFSKLNNALMTAGYLTTLPLSLLASLTEPFVAFERMRQGEKASVAQSIWRATEVALRGWEKTLRAHPDEVALRYMHEAGQGLESASMERLASAMGSAETGHAVLRVPFSEKYIDTQKVTDTFFKTIGLSGFTRWQKMTANHLGFKLIEGNLRELMEGKVARGSRREEQLVKELGDLGINPVDGFEWIKRGAKDTDQYFPSVRIGAARFTNDIVMHPQANSRPLWHSNPHWALVSQLKGFQTMFGNVVVRRWLSKMFGGDVKGNIQNMFPVLGVASMMMMTSMLVAQAKQAAVWYPNGNLNPAKNSPLAMMYKAQNNSGFLGPIQFALDALTANQFGESPFAPIVGPIPSKIGDLVQAIGTGGVALMKGKTPTALVTWVAKQLPPFAQSPGLRAELIKLLPTHI